MCSWYRLSLVVDTTTGIVHRIGELLGIKNVSIKECLLPFLVSTHEHRVRKNGDGFAHSVIIVGT